MADSKPTEKVFDIAKPGGPETPIGSKPMVIGHSFMQSDPTLSAPELPSKESSDKTASKAEGEAIKTPAKKIILQPISSSEPASDLSETKVSDSQQDTEKKDQEATPAVEEIKNKSASQDSESVEDENLKSENAETAKLEQTPEERDVQIEQIVESKQYFVNIKEPKSGITSMNSKSAYIAAVIIFILGVFIALDSGLVDIGIELPFDLL